MTLLHRLEAAVLIAALTTAPGLLIVDSLRLDGVMLFLLGVISFAWAVEKNATS